MPSIDYLFVLFPSTLYKASPDPRICYRVRNANVYPGYKGRADFEGHPRPASPTEVAFDTQPFQPEVKKSAPKFVHYKKFMRDLFNRMKFTAHVHALRVKLEMKMGPRSW